MPERPGLVAAGCDFENPAAYCACYRRDRRAIRPTYLPVLGGTMHEDPRSFIFFGRCLRNVSVSGVRLAMKAKSTSATLADRDPYSGLIRPAA